MLLCSSILVILLINSNTETMKKNKVFSSNSKHYLARNYSFIGKNKNYYKLILLISTNENLSIILIIFYVPTC